MRRSRPAAFVLLLGCPGAPDDTAGDTAVDTAADPVDACVPEAIPAAASTVPIEVSRYDPAADCWRREVVQFDAAYWPAGDTGAECDDITLLGARVDCSCVVFGSQCPGYVDAVLADPSFDHTDAAYTRCATIAATSCP